MPRYLSITLAVCAVVLTLAIVLHLRWREGAQGFAVDTWTGRMCVVTPVTDDPLRAAAKAEAQRRINAGEINTEAALDSFMASRKIAALDTATPLVKQCR